VHDPAAVVATFPSEREAATEVAVELCTEVDQGLDGLGRLPYQLLNDRAIGKAGSGCQSVGNVLIP
jgi:hypothetical protein